MNLRVQQVQLFLPDLRRFLNLTQLSAVSLRLQRIASLNQSCISCLTGAAVQQNIETVHEPEPIQTAGTLCMDKVAVLWKVPTAHKLRDLKERVPTRRHAIGRQLGEDIPRAGGVNLG